MLQTRRLTLWTLADVVIAAFRVNIAGRDGLAWLTSIGAMSLVVLWLGHEWLAELSATIGTQAMDWVEMPVLHVDGVVVYAGGIRSVSDACGGRDFQCFMTFAVLLYAFCFERHRRIRYLLLAASLPCTVWAGAAMVAATSLSTNKPVTSAMSIAFAMVSLATVHRFLAQALCRQRRKISCE